MSSTLYSTTASTIERSHGRTDSMTVLTKRGGFLERQGDSWGKRSGFGEVVEVTKGKSQLDWLTELNVDLRRQDYTVREERKIDLTCSSFLSTDED